MARALSISASGSALAIGAWCIGYSALFLALRVVTFHAQPLESSLWFNIALVPGVFALVAVVGGKCLAAGGFAVLFVVIQVLGTKGLLGSLSQQRAAAAMLLTLVHLVYASSVAVGLLSSRRGQGNWRWHWVGAMATWFFVWWWM